MNPLQIPVEEFLRPFFDPGEKVRLRIFDDRKLGTFRGLKLESTLPGIRDMLDTLHKHNAQNRGVFFVVNAGGHEDSEITRVTAQFVECDDISLKAQWEQLQAFPVEPSIIVKTRKSLHAYWLMQDADLAAFRRVQKRLIAHFDGDKSCINESRVLRLPGFLHCKAEPLSVQCVKFNPELRYTQAELEAVLPKVEDEPAQPKVTSLKGSRQGLHLVQRRCEFVKHCTMNAATLPESDWYAMISNLAVFEGGESLIHKLSAPYPKYSYGETQQKMEHFMASGTKPMTCRTIAEKGFRCPRLEDGSCPCKAPAALCYLPAAAEDLRSILEEVELSGRSVEDMQKAQDYIEAYLYNVDPIIAGTFIQEDVRLHFGLKAMYTKPLESRQKELYRAWAASKDTKRESLGEELPDWYEPTDKGGVRFLPGILANHLSQNEDILHSAGAFYEYEQGVYKMREDIWASSKVRSYMVPRYTTLNAMTDVVGQWRALIQRPVRELNTNPFVLNLRNGLYNVLDGSFMPHTPAFLSTVQINASYNEEAQAPQFISFLDSVLGAPEIRLVQQIFGYLLLPINKAQKSFVFVGAANAGKSTLLTVAQEILLGSDNVSNIPWQNLGDRFNKAELFGKLANVFADLPSKAIDDNGMFKALTGEDYITAERKNKDPFSFRPYARFLFSCNEIPRNYSDRSDGFYRRLLIIRFHHSVPPAKRDPHLIEKLSAERDGILMWALNGLRELIAQNYVFSETEATKAELQKYRVESNSVLSFAKEYCAIDEQKFCIRDTLYQQYKEHCICGGLKPVSQQVFNREIEFEYPSITRSRDKVSGCRVWRGISYCEGGNSSDL